MMKNIKKPKQQVFLAGVELNELRFEVHGLDFSSTAIDWARENVAKASQNIQFNVADVADLYQYGNETFDVIYDGNCLHCILGDQRAKALSEWKRVLKPSGLLFISSMCTSDACLKLPPEFDPDSKILTESGSPFGHANFHAVPAE